MKQQKENFKDSKNQAIDFLLHLPENYDKISNHPLILFLHGAGERGKNLEILKRHGISKIVEEKENFPFITISPQCPIDDYWNLKIEILKELLDFSLKNYKIDKERIYLTGLSMGGFGAWSFAIEHPEYFAAVAPVCGGEDPAKVDRIKNIPFWVFHGAKDNVVPVYYSDKMVAALIKTGGNVKYTIYKNAGHDSWTETYNNPELYEWFLKHKKNQE